MPTVCIVCQQQKDGTPVKDDVILSSIRRIKQSLNIAKNNTLVVCAECLEEHKKRRQNFEKSMIQFGGLGLLILVILLLLLQNIQAFLIGIVFAAFTFSLSIIKYHPST